MGQLDRRVYRLVSRQHCRLVASTLGAISLGLGARFHPLFSTGCGSTSLWQLRGANPATFLSRGPIVELWRLYLQDEGRAACQTPGPMHQKPVTGSPLRDSDSLVHDHHRAARRQLFTTLPQHCLGRQIRHDLLQEIISVIKLL